MESLRWLSWRLRRPQDKTLTTRSAVDCPGSLERMNWQLIYGTGSTGLFGIRSNHEAGSPISAIPLSTSFIAPASRPMRIYGFGSKRGPITSGGCSTHSLGLRGKQHLLKLQARGSGRRQIGTSGNNFPISPELEERKRSLSARGGVRYSLYYHRVALLHARTKSVGPMSGLAGRLQY
jgi:hypothetical protein